MNTSSDPDFTSSETIDKRKRRFRVGVFRACGRIRQMLDPERSLHGEVSHHIRLQ